MNEELFFFTKEQLVRAMFIFTYAEDMEDAIREAEQLIEILANLDTNEKEN